jgi:hypothetical protein
VNGVVYQNDFPFWLSLLDYGSKAEVVYGILPGVKRGQLTSLERGVGDKAVFGHPFGKCAYVDEFPLFVPPPAEPKIVFTQAHEGQDLRPQPRFHPAAEEPPPPYSPKE